LFSIVNRLGTGSIFSVNDISGIPSIDVDANGTIKLAEFSGNVGVGATAPSEKLDVIGNLRVTGNYIGNVVRSINGLTATIGLSAGPSIVITASGNTLTIGASGIQGAQGIQGIQGIQGRQGTQGLQGLTGPQGTQGLQGSTGPQGTQGLQGTQGTQGLQGTQGIQGLQGIQGIQGTQSIQGIQGIQGSTGSQGIQGIAGSAASIGNYVVSFNGLTGAVTGVTTGTINRFNPIQVFLGGFTGLGATFENDIGVGRSIDPAAGPVLIGGAVAIANTRVGIRALGILQNTLTSYFNTAIGYDALAGLTGKDHNTAVGYGALRVNTANNSTAVGSSSLTQATIGVANNALGYSSLGQLIQGNHNIGIGTNAGEKYGTSSTDLTAADQSIFIGSLAKANSNNQTNQIVIGYNVIGDGSNTTVIGNSSTSSARIYGLIRTDSGICAGGNLTIQGQSTIRGQGIFPAGICSNGATFGSLGTVRLYNGFTSAEDIFVRGGRIGGAMASGNIAIGRGALNLSTIGSNNISIGTNTLALLDNASGNVAIGSNALDNNKTGANNVVIGNGAGDLIDNGSQNIIIGYLADIGANSGFSGATNSIVIGNVARGLGSSTTVIGNSNTISARIFGNIDMPSGFSASGDIRLHGAVVGSTTGTAPKYFARSWVRFQGTGTVTINASGNVSSITDHGTGNYGVNFTTAMGDTAYAAVGNARRTTATIDANVSLTFIPGTTAFGASQLRVITGSPSTSGAQDCDIVTVAVYD
jgi:hypothetical protein